MRTLLATLVLTGVLAACAPATQPFDPDARLDPAALGPKNSQLEWWYVSGYLPESRAAFHWAQFKTVYRGVPYFVSHVAVTDLETGKLVFQEQNSGGTEFRFPPLLVRQGDWQLREDGGRYALDAGPVKLSLTPLKNSVVHPPGYSGTAEVGRMYYQSVTRLDLRGTLNGREVRGLAWMDHQWGDQIPGQQALWDWFGLHLSNGVDLMVYRVKDASGKVVQLAGSWVDPQGVAREVRDLRAVPRETWRSPTGREYTLGWDLVADGFTLKVDAVRREQELLSPATVVAYWEGPVRGAGTWGDQPITAEGMGEFVGGSLLR
ncbi:lipocalin family protein [Deinococcus pimensis]|uniref:lipocalin family protein n=1 Tax=Deinococcus pimensis TaxID=309888 RepID=UPI000481DAAA|nr:lipocalin family protein [Deinococcus pimensis]